MPKRDTYSPLRYPGGKIKLSNYIEQLIYINRLNKSTYIEPFAGGAGVALYLLLNKHVTNICINDFDRSIYAFWYSILHHTDEFCEMILKTPVDLYQWHEQKNIQKYKNSESLLKLGFSTFFLNRTNFSGIIKAGVIGGIKQDGKYKIDCRFNKTNLINRIMRIATLRNSIELFNMDTADLISQVLPSITSSSFIFFDPPYYSQGSKLYSNYYKYKDHLKLKDKISKIDYHYWIVTYDSEPVIQQIYKPFRQTTYGIKYTAEKKYTGQEIMIYCNEINLPKENKIIL